VINAFKEKKATQNEYSNFWKMQMGMNETKSKEAAINAQQDPETMWTVEAPTRKK